MQSGAGPNGFKKLFRICTKHNILHHHLTKDNNTVLQYGPLGSLLKKNIFKEWLYSLINNNDVTLFPLEVVNPCKQSILADKNPEQSCSSLIKAVVRNYFESLSLLGCNSPFGFAAYGPCLDNFSSYQRVSDVSDLKLKDFKSWTHISMVFFCPPKKAMHWFHYWTKQRYLWWRKFSSIPSKFSMSEVIKTHSDLQQLSLLHEFPCGNNHLESISLYENKFVEDIFHSCCNQNNGPLNQSSVPSLVVCESGLDLAVLTYLSNSFAERWRDGQVKNILQMHYKLAPYKVCLLLEEQESEKAKKLKNVSVHLSKELRESGVLLYPTLDTKFSSQTESHFRSFDEMGLPYTVILNEDSLQTGVAGLRNRDTTLQEQVHITELTSKLLKYLKVKS